MILITQSVVAKQPSTRLELVFSRGLLFTDMMTSVFKTIVNGHVITFTNAINTSTA